MGKTQSKEADNNGQVVNNVVIEDTVNIENKQIALLLLIIVIIKAAEFAYKLYKDHKRSIKKKYLNTPAVIKV